MNDNEKMKSKINSAKIAALLEKAKLDKVFRILNEMDESNQFQNFEPVYSVYDLVADVKNQHIKEISDVLSGIMIDVNTRGE